MTTWRRLPLHRFAGMGPEYPAQRLAFLPSSPGPSLYQSLETPGCQTCVGPPNIDKTLLRLEAGTDSPGIRGGVHRGVVLAHRARKRRASLNARWGFRVRGLSVDVMCVRGPGTAEVART